MPRVAVLCWEESRPWVSALRQEGFSVPWVDEPKAEVQRQIPEAQPDVLLVDLTRLPQQGKRIVEELAANGALDGVPVVLVSETGDDGGDLTEKVKAVSVSPSEIVAAVKAAVSAP
ncbi:MAG: hypothetical protein M3164_00250 [Actinomycetota bacterium]|nr:hypothetical protein [Actinomycetota bacterium]